jgi:hypothetical protein
MGCISINLKYNLIAGQTIDPNRIIESVELAVTKKESAKIPH